MGSAIIFPSYQYIWTLHIYMSKTPNKSLPASPRRALTAMAVERTDIPAQLPASPATATSLPARWYTTVAWNDVIFINDVILRERTFRPSCLPAQPMRRHSPPAGTPRLPEMTSYLPMTSHTERAYIPAQLPASPAIATSLPARWYTTEVRNDVILTNDVTERADMLARFSVASNIWRHSHQCRQNERLV